MSEYVAPLFALKNAELLKGVAVGPLRCQYVSQLPVAPPTTPLLPQPPQPGHSCAELRPPRAVNHQQASCSLSGR